MVWTLIVSMVPEAMVVGMSDRTTKSASLLVSIEPLDAASECRQTGQIVVDFSAVVTSTLWAGTMMSPARERRVTVASRKRVLLGMAIVAS
nr:hypothetical protein [Paracoccus sp. PAR01]